MSSHKIAFEKPGLTQLGVSHTVVDMHVHTNCSDGLNSAHAVAKRAAKLGIGIAVTDHNEIQGALEVAEEKHVFSIPGIEVTSKEGSHLLVYFYETGSLRQFYRADVIPFMGAGVMTSLSLSMEEVIERARKYRTVVVFAHPYCAAYTGVCNLHFPKDRLDNLMSLVDGVEVINAGNLNKWNLQCAVLGFNLNKAVTGGSDAHSLNHMGRAVTYMPGEVNRETFLDAVKESRVRVIGKELNMFRKMTSHSSKIRSSLSNYPDLMEKNLRYGATYFNSKSKKIRENMRRSIMGKA
jgi:predicted metal-dependent phosphoesterase TrpH